MAFGIKRKELLSWKEAVQREEIAFITHYWIDYRWPEFKTVTKVGCVNIEKLVAWGNQYGLKREWIHVRDKYPHFDLMGIHQKEILEKENKLKQLKRLER